MSYATFESLAQEKLMSAAGITGALFVLLTAGCAGLPNAQPGEPARSVVTQGGTVAPEPAVPPVTSPRESPQPGATPSATTAVEPIVPPTVPSVTHSASPPAAKVESPVAKAPAKVPAPPVPTEQIRKQESAAQGQAKQETAPLDLKSLETELKETKAIGVFTKLALKNQVDDLLNQFRAYYQGRLKTTLAELRRPYDLLLLKVLALLQDTDPALARAIAASREAIWSILADPARFSNI